MRFVELSEVLTDNGFEFHTVADKGSKYGCSWYVELDKNNMLSIYINEDCNAVITFNERTVSCDYYRQVIDVLNFAKACLSINQEAGYGNDK